MTSRERITAALNHQPYEGLAIDFGAMRSTGINAVAYNKLVKHLGFDELPVVYDIFQQLALPSEKVVERMGGDVMQVHRLCPAFGINIKGYKKGQLTDGNECLVPQDLNPDILENGDKVILDTDGSPLAKMPYGGYYYDLIKHPFQDVETVEEMEEAVFPTVTDEELDFIEMQTKHIYENTDKAILLCFGGNIFEQGQLDFGYEEFFVNMLTNKEVLHVYFQKIADAYLVNLEKILARVGKYINVIQFGDDLGTQINSQISVDLYREMIMPYHKVQYQFVRKNHPNVKVFLHSCGAIASLIPSLIEAGVQVLNPIQVSASGMDAAMLKEKFGKDLVFWGGGADMQGFIQSTDDLGLIRDHVKKQIETFNADGTGFVFTQVHNIQYDITPEKVLAIYDAALSFRSPK